MNREALDRLFADPGLGAEIGNRGVRQALREHKLLGHSIVVWKEGRVVSVAPEEIPVDGDAHGEAGGPAEVASRGSEVVS